MLKNDITWADPIVFRKGEIALLIELAENYRDGVKSGSISGYGQSMEGEMDDITATLRRLRGKV